MKLILKIVLCTILWFAAKGAVTLGMDTGLSYWVAGAVAYGVVVAIDNLP